MYIVKPQFITRNIADEWLLIPRGEYALEFKASILLNETAADIVSYLSVPRSEESILEYVCEKYDIDREIAHSDIKEILQQMIDEKILDIID